MTPLRHVFIRVFTSALIGGLSLAMALPASGAPTATTAPNAAAPNATPDTDSLPPCTITKRRLVPSCGAYLGVGANPRHGESYDEAHLNWEQLVGRTADIVHYYARGETAVFPTALQITRATTPGTERMLFINWRPLHTWRDTADGASDTYLRAVAANIKANFPDRKFFLSLHAEMESEVDPTAGSGMTAIDFRDFFRHVVDVLRGEGVTNVLYVVNYVGAPNWGDVPWFNDLFPGHRYVDWIAEDPYAFGKPPVWLSDFPTMVNRVQNPPQSQWKGFYDWAVTNHPHKPIMLGEWGVEESPDDAMYKANFFASIIDKLAEFPRLKALVYWDSPEIGIVGDTEVDTTPQALKAFIAAVHSSELTLPGETLLGRPAVPD